MKRIWFWARLLLSAGLIVFLLVTVDFRELGASVRQANVTFLSLALLSALLDRVMMAYKWDVLLKAKSIRIPLVKLTGTYLVSTFLGLFLPATLGGDAVRAFAISKEGHNSKDVISSILVERLLGTIALLVLVLASIAFSVFVFGQSFFATLSRLFWILLALSVGLTMLMLLSMNRSLLKRGISLLRSLTGERRPLSVDGEGAGESRSAGGRRMNKLILKLREVYSSYLSFSEDKPALAWFLVLSFVENLFPIFNAYFLALAFGLDVPLLYFFILIPIVLVLVRLPISIDGIGIHEGAFVYFLTLIGVARADALLLGISTHILAVISILPGGLLYGLGGLSGAVNAPDYRRVRRNTAVPVTGGEPSKVKARPEAKAVSEEDAI